MLSGFDYSQIEPRIFGYYVMKGLNDPTIVDWYKEGRDVYNEIASRAYQRPADTITKAERDNGKMWFLMTLYSAGPKKIAQEQGITYKEAKDFYLSFHEGIPQIKALSNPKPQSQKAMHHWTPGLIEKVISQRGFLKTPWGRHLHPEQYGHHKMLNKLIQGSAADMMKASLIRVWRAQKDGTIPRTRMVATIHDEILMDGPESELAMLNQLIPRLMTDEPDITTIVPLAVDHEVYRDSWAAKEEFTWQT